MLRIALTAFLLCLVCPAPGRAQDGLLPVLKPVSVQCVLPGGKDAKPREQRIQVAPGQNPLTACPPGATTYLDFGSSPGRFPSVSNIPPPGDWSALQMEQDNIAKDELRALELRNKTSGQQTSGHSP